MRLVIRRTFTLVAILAILGALYSCHDDDRDLPFPDTGYRTHGDAAGGMFTDQGLAIAIDSGGNFVVAGRSWNAAGDFDMVVWRLKSNGLLDKTFGGSGFVVDDGAAGGMFDDEGHAIAVDGTDRIVVAGWSTNAVPNKDLAIWRFNPDGTLDGSFGGGIVIHDDAAGGGGDDVGLSVAIDLGGFIVVGGWSTNGTPDTDMAVWRFDTTGALDTTFNAQGWVTHDGAAGGTGDDVATSIGIDGAGKIIAAGWSTNATLDEDVAVWRFDGMGALDTTFNGQGWVTHDNAAGGAGDDRGHALAMFPSGRIVVAGSSLNAALNSDMVLWQIGVSGALDPNFGGAGFVVHRDAAEGMGNDVGRGVLLDGTVNIIVTGESGSPAGNQDMVIWRFKADGAIDDLFNQQGWIVHTDTAGGTGDDAGHAVTLNAAGSIHVAGSSSNASGDQDMVVWRQLQ